VNLGKEMSARDLVVQETQKRKRTATCLRSDTDEDRMPPPMPPVPEEAAGHAALCKATYL
jgi:hypothetical protein